MALISGLSVSWITSRSQPARFWGGGGLPAISTEGLYRTEYDDARRYSSSGVDACYEGSYTAPWPAGSKQISHYWAKSLGGGYASSDNSKRAWKYQVPLRANLPVSVSPTITNVGIWVDRFVYPTGSSVILTARMGRTLEYSKGLAAGLDDLSSGFLIVNGSTPLTPPAALNELMDQFETALTGSIDPDGIGPDEPWTLATVTAATGWTPVVPAAQGNDIHRLLEGLCKVESAPLTGAVGILDDIRIREIAKFLDTTRALTGRGACIWSPLTAATASGAGKLQCYHRNLALLIAQTSMLLDTARWMSQAGPSFLSHTISQTMRVVLQLLGFINGQVPEVYTSRIARRIIKESGQVPDINQLRSQLSAGRDLDV